MVNHFVPNAVGIAELARTTQMVDALEEIANAVAERAQASAPVDTGDYRNGIKVESGVENERATARVNATDWKSGLIEFGDGRRVLAPLRKAVEAEGLELRSS